MSAFDGLWKNRFHVLSNPGQPGQGENVSAQWLVKDRIHVPTKQGKPRQECQRSMAYEKSNSRTS